MRTGFEERPFSPVPLVPTALRGTHGWRERRRCHITFSDPIDVSDLAGHNPKEATREAARRVWEAVQKLEAGLGLG